MEPLRDVVAAFGRAMRAEGLERESVETYLVGLRQYTRWLETDVDCPCVLNVTGSTLRDFMAHIADRGLASATRASRHRTLRRFTGWLHTEGLTPDRVAMPRPPKQAETEVPVLTDDQIRALLRTCTGKSFTDRRDHAILRLFLDTGIRLTEMSSLRRDDLDLDSGVVRVVRGKGGKFRVVWFGSKTSTAIDRYLRLRANHHKTASDKLWIGEQGGLSASGVRQVVYRRGSQAGVRVHPHQFRHTFAHRWLAEGGGEGDLMRLAGWSSSAMIRVYGRSAASERAIQAARKMGLGDRY